MFAATASNASSIPTMCAFQAPSTMLVHGPKRLVGAVVASTVSCHSNVDRESSSVVTALPLHRPADRRRIDRKRLG